MGVADSGTFHHTCCVVHDPEKVAQSLADTLAIRPWNLWTVEPENGTVHGKQAAYSLRIALAQVGDAYYELISPHTGDSVYTEHLQSKGEGLHHT